MKIISESHTYDGTGRAGFCPLDPVTTQAKTRAGILKAWSKAVSAEYQRKIKFQEDYRETVEKLDAIAANGVWIAEGRATDGAHRYRLTAYAEKAGPLFVGAFEVSRDFYEYATEAEHIEALRDKYATR